MILTINIGNTHVHIGQFDGDVLRASWKLSTDSRRTPDEYALQIQIILGKEAVFEGGIIASDVPHVTPSLVTAVTKACNIEPMVMNFTTEIGIQNGYERPSEVGMDRLANAAGANLMYGAPVFVLDFGTAITLDYLAPGEPGEDKPIYRGGAIMPGLEMAAESLSKGTAKLPPVGLVDPVSVIGRTTVESIRSGLINGYLGAIRALVELAWEEIGTKCKVVSTGGDAQRFAARMPYVDAVQPDLTLYGLRQIYGINHDCPMTRP